jgi:hypothetical protein
MCYGGNARTVYRCGWRLWTVGSPLNGSCGCDWLDLQVDRTVRMGWGVIGCVAVYTVWRGATGSKRKLF